MEKLQNILFVPDIVGGESESRDVECIQLLHITFEKAKDLQTKLLLAEEVKKCLSIVALASSTYLKHLKMEMYVLQSEKNPSMKRLQSNLRT